MRAAVLIFSGFNALAFGMAFFPKAAVAGILIVAILLPLRRPLGRAIEDWLYRLRH